MRIGLSSLSFGYRCGFIGHATSRAISAPMDIDGLMTLAARAGLQSLQFPFTMLPDLDSARLATLRERFMVCGLTPMLESDVVDEAALTAQIPAALALGASTICVLLSPVVEGARHTLATPWAEYLAEMIERLRRLRPLAEHYGIRLALKNQQDVTAAELAHVCREVGGAAIGIALDPINTFGVVEEPLTTIRSLAPFLCSIQLADYSTYASRQGYRLVRSALGEGDLDFRPLFELLGEVAPDITCQIAIAGHNSRHIRLLDDEWWQGYGPRDIRDLLPALRIIFQNARSPDEDWRTPWERGADETIIAFYEDQQFAASLAFLRALGMLG